MLEICKCYGLTFFIATESDRRGHVLHGVTWVQTDPRSATCGARLPERLPVWQAIAYLFIGLYNKPPAYII